MKFIQGLTFAWPQWFVFENREEILLKQLFSSDQLFEIYHRSVGVLNEQYVRKTIKESLIKIL
jgi:hypothetical protein